MKKKQCEQETNRVCVKNRAWLPIEGRNAEHSISKHTPNQEHCMHIRGFAERASPTHKMQLALAIGDTLAAFLCVFM